MPSGQGSGMSPLVIALLSLLASRAMGSQGTGGLGDLLGGRAGGGLAGSLGGGLDGLLEQFGRAGQGDTFRSWVGPGENRPIQPNELEQALGPEEIDALSQQTGMPCHDMLNELADVLPGVVDMLTPQGRMPTNEEMQRW
jgi:uncharacterized protein YidB (DUF937 family)